MEFDICLVGRPSAGSVLALTEALAQMDTARLVAVIPQEDVALLQPLTQRIEKAALLQLEDGEARPQARRKAAAQGTAAWILFLDAERRVSADFFSRLVKAADEPYAGFECRQLPFEPEHVVDPLTLGCEVMDFSAALVRRDVYTAAGGFSPLFNTAGAAAADFCARAYAAGARFRFWPQAVTVWPDVDVPPKPDLAAYAGGWYEGLLLRDRYAGRGERRQAVRRYRREMVEPQHYPGVRKALLKGYVRHMVTRFGGLLWQNKNRALAAGVPVLFDENNRYATLRHTGFLPQPCVQGPLISVVVRTCKRPQLLRNALRSIENQTYRNFEVVVVEDGEPVSQAMVAEEFADLPVRYYSTGQNVGRAAAGNLGLEKASGAFCNFLDDDDYFYPEHLEYMADFVNRHPQADLVLGCSMVMMAEQDPETRLPVTVESLHSMRFDRLDLFTMCQTCQIPIQSAMFRRALYQQHGGLFEGLEANEDWAMWLRYLAEGNRVNTKTVDVRRETSVFVLPANRALAQQRIEEYKVYNRQFFEDPRLQFTVNLADMRGYYDDVLGDVRHLQRVGGLDAYLDEQAHRNE